MLNRGGRYFNQMGRNGQVGIHKLDNPNWFIESKTQREKMERTEEPPNTIEAPPKHAVGGEDGGMFGNMFNE